MKWPMSWRTRAMPLKKNLSFLGSRSMDPSSSLLLRVRTSMHNLLEDENMGHRLPRDGAPNKALLESVTAVNTMRAAQLRSTTFVTEALLCPDASGIRKTIAKCNDPTVKCWMRMISRTYPVNAYLHRIKKVKSPNCTFCDRGELALSQGVPSIPSCSNHSTQQGATSSVHAAPETRLSRLESCRRNSYVSNWSPSSRCAHSWSAADERFKTLKSKEVRWA